MPLRNAAQPRRLNGDLRNFSSSRQAAILASALCRVSGKKAGRLTWTHVKDGVPILEDLEEAHVDLRSAGLLDENNAVTGAAFRQLLAENEQPQNPTGPERSLRHAFYDNFSLLRRHLVDAGLVVRTPSASSSRPA